MLKTTLALGAMLLSTSIFAESYLCVTEMGAGLVFNKSTKSWRGAGLADDRKFILKQGDGVLKSFAWTITEMGEKNPFMFCDKDFEKSGTLSCNGTYQFRMNKESGRFLLIYEIGYWTDDKNAKAGELFREGDDTPHMLGGKCSSI